MSQFSEQALLPCNSKSKALSDSEISELMPQLSEWNVVEAGGMPQLTREYRFSNFIDALAFANQVGDIAELENHHPCLCVEWGKARVSWWTHSLAGLFINDFIMASRCDELYDTMKAD